MGRIATCPSRPNAEPTFDMRPSNVVACMIACLPKEFSMASLNVAKSILPCVTSLRTSPCEMPMCSDKAASAFTPRARICCSSTAVRRPCVPIADVPAATLENTSAMPL